jgi:uncharacterized protein
MHNNMVKTRPTALITGASGGIGQALASQFAGAGFDVVLAARSVTKLEATARSLQSQHGGQAIAIPADLEDPDGAVHLHAAVKAKGITLQALVNNAGYGLFGEFAHSKLDDELRMMQLNMTSLTVLSKLFLPDLLATRGQLLNVASTAAFQPGPSMAIYYATKAFVLSFTEALASELEGTGVRVMALCPGPTASGFQDKAAMKDSALVKGKKLPSADAVAAAGFAALQAGKRVFIPGAQNWIGAQSVRFLPRNMVTSLVKNMSKAV